MSQKKSRTVGGPRARTTMHRFELPGVPEFLSHRPCQNTARHTRALGHVPRGWQTTRIDIALFHRGPVALVPDGFGYRRKRLDPRRYPVCGDGRYFLGYFPNAQSEYPWRPALQWLLDLTDGFEIAATAWCSRGSRVALNANLDIFLPLPHAWDWTEFVMVAGWVFCNTDEECAAMAPSELPAVLELRQ